MVGESSMVVSWGSGGKAPSTCSSSFEPASISSPSSSPLGGGDASGRELEKAGRGRERAGRGRE
jgi:hypothetical protein